MFSKQQLISSLKQKGFSEKILNAFLKVPRENFIPFQIISHAYEDTSLPIGNNQTISQPYTIAEMLELLELKKGQKVLEVGSGCGYVLALLSEIVGEKGKVYGIEIIKELFENSKQNLKDYKNIEIYNKNGAEGLSLEENATFVRGISESRRSEFRGESTRETTGSLVFDRILISAACTEIPKPLIQQLKNKGIIVAPIGNQYSQTLTAIQKINDEPKIKKEIPGFIFVPFVNK